MHVMVCGGVSYVGDHMAKGQVTGKLVPHTMAPRRAGDPAVLVASSDKARRELGWSPRYVELAPIIESARRWHANPCF